MPQGEYIGNIRLIVSGKQSPVVAFCLYHDTRHNSMTNVTISILL